MKLDQANALQTQMVEELEESGASGKTIVAFALARAEN
jgi:hypothetical protein